VVFVAILGDLAVDLVDCAGDWRVIAVILGFLLMIVGVIISLTVIGLIIVCH